MIFKNFIFLLIIAIVFSIPYPSYVEGSEFNDLIYPPDANPHGISYAEWTAIWQEWLFSIPLDKNPALDKTGELCAINQEGPVWFLAGTTGGIVERECEIPYGKDILFPIISSLCDGIGFPNVNTIEEKTVCAQADNNNAIKLKVIIDGTELNDLEEYRITSPLFEIEYPKNNIMGFPSGNTTAVGDGFWVFLKPLEKGDHNIHFSGVTPSNPATGSMAFVVDTSYKIKIK